MELGDLKDLLRHDLKVSADALGLAELILALSETCRTQRAIHEDEAKDFERVADELLATAEKLWLREQHYAAREDQMAE